MTPLQGDPAPSPNGLVAGGRYVVAEAGSEDYNGWLSLWHEYCAYFHAPAVEDSDQLWRQLVDGHSDIGALVLRRVGDGQVIGFANYVFHKLTWTTKPALRFQALFVTASERGLRGGEVLLRSIIDRAHAHGCAYAYLITRDYNAVAQRLFDRLGKGQPSLVYKWPIEG